MHQGDLDKDKVIKFALEVGVENQLFDNDHSIGDEMGVTAWPTYFLFDNEGKLRRYAPGDLGVRVIEQVLIRIFGE
jgi:thioredoxin-related protein